MTQLRSFFLTLLTLSLVLVAFSYVPHVSHADTSDDIQAQIDEHNKKIQALNDEISAYQRTLTDLGTQHQTLSSAIKTIDVSRQQTSTQVKVTQNKIAATDLTLTQLRRDIATKQDLIELNRDSVAESLRNLEEKGEVSLVEQVFASDTLTDAWTDIDNLAQVSETLHNQVQILTGAKLDLSVKEGDAATTRTKLASLNSELVSQQKALDVAKSEKAKLLSVTQSQESTYQTLIAQKRAEQASFESALFQLSAQLKSLSDPSAIPSAGQGILAWPLSAVTITQQFGKTSDSGRLYASGTHDGIDLAAAIGTPVHAALTGTVLEINQGAVQNCQYGKWVLIKHANGLTTLYAHLSQIAVTKGQSVTTGATIGYSGMTGYATGPHLHFTVYASEGVTLKQYTCKSGPTVTIPIAPPDAYLNPISYL